MSSGLAIGAIGTSAADDGELLRDSSGEECANAEALEGAGDNFEENCLTESEIAEAAEAILPVGGVDGTPNLTLESNLPKSGAFTPEGAFNSDLAFQGKYAFAGNYQGFSVYDLSNPRKPSLVAQVLCPGSQNDISVYGDLLFLSTDSRWTDDSCNAQGPLNTQQTAANPNYWEGMKIFDISDVRNPRYVAAVETKCGSHTHTLVPGDDSVYIYVSSYDVNSQFAKCKPPHDIISIIDVPLDEPEAAAVVAEPVLFPDAANQGSNTRGCHDITAYPHLGLAAGACMGDGIVMDITDPVNPVILDQVRDPNFAFWHSATFNNEGTSIIFTDELGGGSGPTCNPTVGPVRGANAIYTWDGDELEFASYYKIPREQSNTENCVAHNGSLIPVPGKDIFVQAWYQGGISVFDFTDPYNPTEIAWFDRGPLDAGRLILGGAWSTYYYNGYIYSNEIQRGFDVFNLRDPRVAPAKGTRYDEFNAQTQPVY